MPSRHFNLLDLLEYFHGSSLRLESVWSSYQLVLFNWLPLSFFQGALLSVTLLEGAVTGSFQAGVGLFPLGAGQKHSLPISGSYELKLSVLRAESC